MKISKYILLACMIGLLLGCSSAKPNFAETVIDENAPEHLWMKTSGDIDSDGRIDILVGGRKSGGLVAYLAPDWKKTIIKDSIRISTNAEICDVNNDKVPDIVAVVDRSIVWFSGPEYSLHHIDSVVGHDVEVYDFDDDGFLDVIARNQGAFGGEGGRTLYFYHQKPLGTWTRHQKEIADGEGLKMADLNKDKKQDIVTNAYWFENTGDFTKWIEHKFTDTWTWPNTYIDVADINNDGLSDILLSPAELAKTYYRVSWFEAPNDPTSLWKEHTVADSIEAVIHSIGAADFDADGKMDVIIAQMQQGADPDEVAIFYHERKDTWQKQVISTGGSHSMRVLDLDGDGDMDVFGANFAENVVKLWINERKK